MSQAVPAPDEVGRFQIVPLEFNYYFTFSREVAVGQA